MKECKGNDNGKLLENADISVSIIIPVYNAEKYLPQCLDSVCGQTWKSIEILCIDDSSTDESRKCIERYQKQDTRIQLYTKENEGVSLARNLGLKKATGDYIMFVDADDWMDPGTCEQALKMAEETQADLVIWSYMREFGRTSLPKKIFPFDKYIFEGEEVKEKLHRRYIGLLGEEFAHMESADALCPVWGKLYKRRMIEENKIRFVDIRKIGTYEDGLFNLQVMQYVKKAVYLQKYWYHYRKDAGQSITSQYKPELLRQWQYLYGYMEHYIRKNQLGENYEQALKNRICLGVLGQGLNLMNSSMSDIKKYRRIKKMLNLNNYREAYQKLDFTYFPLHWKVFYGCAKYKLTVFVFFLLKVIQRKIGN